MKYDIATACSNDYTEVLRLCMPSWIRNSGAESITVYPFSIQEKDPRIRWYLQAARRCQIMASVVCSAANRGQRLLFLDTDCFVLSPLHNGFSSEKPISIARWPDINMGVLFFNTLIPFPWMDFFSVLIPRITKRCHWLIDNPPKKWVPGDQDVWREQLHTMVEHVDKLDANVWNFCYSAHEWEDRLKHTKDSIKVLHIKTRHHGLNTPTMDFIRREFPHVL